MEITAKLVKDLREITSAGMMECKRHYKKLMEIWKKLSNF